jgi:hypothetical protein
MTNYFLYFFAIGTSLAVLVDKIGRYSFFIEDIRSA